MHLRPDPGFKTRLTCFCIVSVRGLAPYCAVPSASYTLVFLGDAVLEIQLHNAAIDESTYRRVRRLWHALEAAKLPGVTELVPAYATVAVYYDPVLLAGANATAAGAADSLAEGVRKALTHAEKQKMAGFPARSIVIPVSYGGDFGPDLARVAGHARLAPEEVIKRHSGADYFVHFVGFLPGFAYLGGLPPELAVPRRAQPRSSVPAGAVAIGGALTGVYPLASPGGWNLVGRTPLRFFRPEENPPVLVRAGDHVRFKAVPRDEFDRIAEGEARTRAEPPETASGKPGDNGLAAPDRTPAIRVVRPGMFTTVQDLGRSGLQQYGLAGGGAADAVEVRLLNRLVANAEGAAVLEITLNGPELEFDREVLVAWGGGEFPVAVGGQTVPANRPVRLTAGMTLSFGQARHGCRAWLAVAGGIDVPVVLASRSTVTRAHLGGYRGRTLAVEDRLPLGSPAPEARRLLERLRATGGWAPTWRAALTDLPWRHPAILRAVRGPEFPLFAPDAQRRFYEAEFQVTNEADRMGVRLFGKELALMEPGEQVSAAVNTGVVQVPPSGQPIVLLPDHQTHGGYPRIGAVIAADFGRLAQLRPGDTVRFEEISLAEAHALHLGRERDLKRLALGLEGHFT